MMGDYTALTAWATVGAAVATTLAVVVALGLGVYPIQKERKEKQERAKNLRIQLIGIIDTIASAPAAKHFEELKGLFPLTTLLSPEEQYAVEGLYLAMCSTPGWPVQVTDVAVQDIAVQATKTSTILRTNA